MHSQLGCRMRLCRMRPCRMAGWKRHRARGSSSRGSHQCVAVRSPAGNSFYHNLNPGPGQPPEFWLSVGKTHFLCSQILLFQPSINVLSPLRFCETLVLHQACFEEQLALLTLTSASAAGNPRPAVLGMIFRFQTPGKGPSLASPHCFWSLFLEAGCSRVVGLCSESLVLPSPLISGEQCRSSAVPGNREGTG